MSTFIIIITTVLPSTAVFFHGTYRDAKSVVPRNTIVRTSLENGVCWWCWNERTKLTMYRALRQINVILEQRNPPRHAVTAIANRQ